MRVRVLSVSLGVIAAVASVVIVSGSASGTPPSGTATELVARATLTSGYAAQVDGIKVKIRGPVDVAVVHVTFQPGGTLGWHSHPGATFVAVKTGTVTRINADDCSSESVSGGHGFFEDPNLVHVAMNTTSEPAETYVTFIVPVGAPLRIDEPAPPNCTP
ncbi:MAG TPA: cupin domain-containing protein [Actinomycetes bacterium]|nr:cupin domain-containing protein [Actinomycetes bacterium]